MVELPKKALFDFLAELDAALDGPVVLVAVGGTALTLMDLKPSTRDVDFTGPGDGIARFREALGRLRPGFKVDTWMDGQVFATTLPEDYLDRSRLVRRFGQIELRHAHPVDVIVTKLGRYDDRDREDIEAMVRALRIRAAEVGARARRVAYAGNEEVFRANLEHLLGRLGPRPKRRGGPANP